MIWHFRLSCVCYYLDSDWSIILGISLIFVYETLRFGHFVSGNKWVLMCINVSLHFSVGVSLHFMLK